MTSYTAITSASETQTLAAKIYQSDGRRVFATLIRRLGDFDRAEEALQDAFRAALEQWPQSGVPANLRNFHLAHAAKADLHRRLGQTAAAIQSYQQALALTQQSSEQRFLQRRLSEMFACAGLTCLLQTTWIFSVASSKNRDADRRINK